MSGYDEALTDFRRRKDEHFASGRGPLSGDALSDFRGLHYYPPDLSWRFQLLVEPHTGRTPEFELQTSTGAPRRMSVLGTVSVPLGEEEWRLTLFAPLGEDQPQRAFLPFRDGTSGRETYGAGRYLDAPLTRTAQGLWVEVDFNLAYHPYCAYAAGWTCPLPPASNVLPAPVRAGERLEPGTP